MASPARFPTSPIQERDAILKDAFALTGDPFPGEPTRGAFVSIPAHSAVLDDIRRWIDEMHASPAHENRLAVLTGEEGSGKSRLVTELTRTIDDEHLHLVRLPDVPSHRTDAQLLKAIIAALDADPAGRTGLELRAEVTSALQALGERGVQTGLLIDDADFKGSQLELIRNLLRDAAGTGFWIILAGTPDLHDRMRRRRSLRGLMGPALTLDDLRDTELAALVTGRIDAVRTSDSPSGLFPAPAMTPLAAWAQGNPARMLHAASAAMLAAAEVGMREVSVEFARETVRQLTIAEANEARAEVAAASARPIQAEMSLPETNSGGSSRATAQQRLWDGEDSV